jgi:hypothetical protein
MTGMMEITPSSWGLLIIFLASTPIFVKLWLENRHTSLVHAVGWATVAWIAWISTLLLEPIGSGPGIYVYLALALTGCAGIAVLGARRPGLSMWNAVVGGLLLVELLPVGEALARQRDFQLNTPRLIVLAGACLVGLINYLPTKAVAGVAALALGCACEWLRLKNGQTGAQEQLDAVGRVALAAAPGAVVLARWLWPTRARSDFDGTWLTFRDRFGVVWGQRLREQFNQSAKHANWRVVLSWLGLRLPGGEPLPDRQQAEAMLDTLKALMKRFGKKESDRDLLEA